MIDQLFNAPVYFFVSFISMVVAITIHEFAHAYAAEHLGDPTPRLLGRLTLNPLAHLDPLGTILIVFASFGWGKPVPFDPFNLRNPRRDSAIISIAGPISNMLLAITAALLYHIINTSPVIIPLLSAISGPGLIIILAFLHSLVATNVVLAIFNLVPVHPLDGFKIVGGLLPEETAREWNQLEKYGILILLFIMFPIFGNTAPVQQFISPVIETILKILIPGSFQ